MAELDERAAVGWQRYAFDIGNDPLPFEPAAAQGERGEGGSLHLILGDPAWDKRHPSPTFTISITAVPWRTSIVSLMLMPRSCNSRCMIWNVSLARS